MVWCGVVWCGVVFWPKEGIIGSTTPFLMHGFGGLSESSAGANLLRIVRRHYSFCKLHKISIGIIAHLGRHRHTPVYGE